MKFALQKLPNGHTRIVDAQGNSLGYGDVDRPVLHVLPKLWVPEEMIGPVSKPYEGLECDEITLTVTTSLAIDIIPEDGVKIRQPYPNRRYFVGGSNFIRNGWIVPLPTGISEFVVEFRWHIESRSIWQFHRADDWQVHHRIHIRLHAGEGKTYSMDASCWPECKGLPARVTPVTVMGFEEESQIDQERRQIMKTSDLVFTEGYMKGQKAGFFLEELVDITGIPLEQAWSIDAFEEEQLHEVQQTTIFLTQDTEAHLLNGPVEMPAELFVKAVKLTREIAFDEESDFAKSVARIPGGMERHPAMKLLCDWWETVRPQNEPLKPGSFMPLVRVCDDGQYWWGSYEIPNVPVVGFNPGGRDAARIGDLILVSFQATQDSALFDRNGMTIMRPSGAQSITLDISRDDYLRGQWDEAFYCLQFLEMFPERFFSAWNSLEELTEKESSGTVLPL